MDCATGWLSASAFKEMHVPGSVRGHGNVSPGGILLLFVVLAHLLPLLVQVFLARPSASSGSPAGLAHPRALRSGVSPTFTVGRHCGLSVNRSTAGGVNPEGRPRR